MWRFDGPRCVAIAGLAELGRAELGWAEPIMLSQHMVLDSTIDQSVFRFLSNLLNVYIQQLNFTIARLTYDRKK